jgi:putative PIN family toxin of toxin-antitoxin system
MTATIRLVLDTNVVIDWLVFNDPYMAPLREQVSRGEIEVLTHELADAELARVLAYPELKLAEDGRTDVLTRYRANARHAVMPEAFAANAWKLPPKFPSCRDRDDDLFLALTYHARATALVTRDKVLLKMRKKVRRFDVTILDVPQMIALLTQPPPATYS